ncbi:NRAMP family divalent metal transporter [Salinivibrio proteolyticus]|uniref:Divalent metal cation transporter n=1 Tax=Salinivibrio proteolyticus TaxID=334715 RepID=A0ABY7LHJ2_9GAMM|nr:divalent metal cation transporter [Salinivibrio proteolyticus]WBA15866.1 divalent metal cation transporter [Salinivibrio proteolyticus]
MQTVSPHEAGSRLSVIQRVRALGPGIMMAAAAVGGSHLVASTKAGAIYGWQLAALILLVNLFKYPFFRAGVQYTAGTGETLVEGYARLGRGYLWLFIVLSAVSGVINTAALTLFSASLLSYFVPFDLSLTALSIIIVMTCLVILIAGHYKALDWLSKVIMATLTCATLVAVTVAIGNPVAVEPNFQTPSIWSVTAIGFIVVTMGWMPAPIEISSITSVWLKRKAQSEPINAKAALFDFNVGYIGTAALAIVFLSLGALLLHGSGVELKQSGIGFSHQLVGLYAATIGEWSRYLIAVVAFFCIFGSTITVIDGYARVVSESQRLLRRQPQASPQVTQGWMLITAVLALGIVAFWTGALLTMLDFAMIAAFVTTPFFALLNYILVTKHRLPPEVTMSKSMRALAIVGLIYLFGFLAVFIWWKWLM